MRATNVEELICALETFDAEETITLGIKNGKNCLLIGDLKTVIRIPYDNNGLLI